MIYISILPLVDKSLCDIKFLLDHKVLPACLSLVSHQQSRIADLHILNVVSKTIEL
jgi:acetoacetate decarboxylase